MAIRIPPPTEFDNLSPEAKTIVDDASEQVKSWIESSIDKIHNQTKEKIER